MTEFAVPSSGKRLKWALLLVIVLAVGYGAGVPILAANASSRHHHHVKHRRHRTCGKGPRHKHRTHHRRRACRKRHHKRHKKSTTSKYTSSAAFFSSNSVWNAPLAASARLDPESVAIVNQGLLSQLKPGNQGIATSNSGVPIYTVGPSQQTVHVMLNQGSANADLQRAFDNVPIPSNAQPAAGPDEVLSVYQPSSDSMWEFFHMTHAGDGWHADGGGRLEDPLTNPGYYQNMKSPSGTVLEKWNWGTTAASFPLVAGVMTIAELQAGSINHALALGITHTCAGEFVAPAQQTDGDLKGDPTCVPEGAHFRLDPSLNLASLNLPHFTLMMAEAAQKYGIIINNRSAGFTFRAEDPTLYDQTFGYNPYFGPSNQPGTSGALFNEWPSQLLKAFPWSHLQLLKMDVRTTPDTTWVVDNG